jgi:hypothetical protein
VSSIPSIIRSPFLLSLPFTSFSHSLIPVQSPSFTFYATPFSLPAPFSELITAIASPIHSSWLYPVSYLSGYPSRALTSLTSAHTSTSTSARYPLTHIPASALLTSPTFYIARHLSIGPREACVAVKARKANSWKRIRARAEQR